VEDLAIVDTTGNAWFVMGGQTVNLANQDYVQRALRGESLISDIIAPEDSAVRTNNPTIIYIVPIESADHRVVGALMSRTNAFDISDMIKPIKAQGESYSYVIHTDGRVVAHATQQNMVLQNLLEMSRRDPAAAALSEATNYMITRKQGYTRYFYEGNTKLCGFAEVPGFNMILVLTAEEASLMTDVVLLRNIVIIVVAFFVTVGTTISVMAANFFSGRLVRFKDVLVLFGNGDLTQQIKIRRNDEIGACGRALNQSATNVLNLVKTIKENAGTLLKIGNELSDEMVHTNKVVTRIIANVDNIKGRALRQSNSVSQTHAAMEQMIMNINKLSDNVEAQNESVTRSSSAIEEMLANIQSVTQTLIKNSENVSTLAKASDAGRSGLQDVANDIQEISRESEGLSEINAVMENIASQTNLLSMNAAIEAAHAGEAGKGFAVVAEEIRKLAESSSEQSKTISVVLKKIKESIEKIMHSTDSVLNRFEAIDGGVKTVAQQEDHIRTSMEEQSTGSRQILEAIGHLNEITRQVKVGSTEMREESKNIIKESQNLEKITADITAAVNEMADGTTQINSAIESVNNTTNQNKDSINVLMTEVVKFKVE
jgi:methyl-accepting chemotaxis protein